MRPQAVATLGMVLVALLACSPRGVREAGNQEAAHHLTALADFDGRLFTDVPLLVAANRNWDVNPDTGAWRFRASASLMVQLADALPDGLVFTFRVVAGDPHRLAFTWDGRSLSDDAVTVRDRDAEVYLASEASTAGAHCLSVRRLVNIDDPDQPEELSVSRIAYRAAGSDEILKPDRVHFYRYVAGFLGHGVAGSYTHDLLGGGLFHGPRLCRINLSGKPGSFRVTTHNSSGEPALFAIRCASGEESAMVEPHGRTVLELRIPADSRWLDLEVEGLSSGLFLWGAPHLQLDCDVQPPPVILITLDTTRRDTLSPWAEDSPPTPCLARMGSHSVIFDRATSTAPWTLPAHVSMLTGLYPSRHRTGVTRQEIPDDVVTVAQLLKDRGYVTAGFVGGFFCASRFGVSRGFHAFTEPEEFELPGDILTDKALAFLEAYADRPLFLFVNYFDPHFPYQAPDRHRRATGADRLTAGLDPSSSAGRVLNGEGGLWIRAIRGELVLPAMAVEALRAEYRAEVSFVDEQLGRLLDSLHRFGLYDEAFIAVVADHGELLGEGGFLGHGCRLDTELVEVPMVVKYPGQRRTRRIDEVVSVVDLFPAMLSAAGVEPPPSDGIGLADGLGRRQVVFSEEHAMGVHQLFANMEVANHMWSMEGRGYRQVAWQGGTTCQQRGASGWTDAACDLDADEVMRLVGMSLAPLDDGTGEDPSDLSAPEREALQALGYLAE